MLIKKTYAFLAVVVLVGGGGCFFNETQSDTQQIDVQLLWQNAAVDCQTTFNAGESNKAWFIEQFQFFLSGFEVGSKEQGWQPLNLISTPFQAHNTVLLGTHCQQVNQQNKSLNSQESQANWTIKFSESKKNTLTTNTSIRFALGVPFAVNHLNPISQPSPLNLPSMFWIWQTGHKFMRLELANHLEQWLFHLGSTGCQSVSAMRAPKSNCLYPNRFYFELPLVENEQGQLAFNIDLASLLNRVELSASASCQSEQDNKSCQQLFNNLLLNSQLSITANVPSVFKAAINPHKSKGSMIE